MRTTAFVLLIALLLLSGSPALAFGPSEGTVHVVQWGDTLYSIAGYYGTTVEAILSANGLADPDQIFVNQRLVIPVGGSTPTGSGTTYTIQWGDTLYSIALRFGTTVDALVAANGLPNAWQIYAGQQLSIPGPGRRSAPASPSPRQQTLRHSVRPGETLTSIAYHYATTVNAIAQANNLYDPSYICVGQSLVIPSGVAATPSGPSTMTYYTVKQGDTCAAIAMRYGLTTWNIAMINNLSNPALIYPGQQLAIPGYAASSRQPEKNVPQATLCDGPECSPRLASSKVSTSQSALNLPPQLSSRNTAPIFTRAWKGDVVSNTSGEADDSGRYFSVLRVAVWGAKDLPVTVTTDDGYFIARGLTGTKPEYGEYAVEFAPIRPGTYRVTPDGLDASVDVTLDGKGDAFVQFYQSDTGRQIPAIMPSVPSARF